MDELEQALLTLSADGSTDIVEVLDVLEAQSPGNPRLAQLRENLNAKSGLVSGLKDFARVHTERAQGAVGITRDALGNARESISDFVSQLEAPSLPEGGLLSRAVEPVSRVAGFPGRMLDNTQTVLGDIDSRLFPEQAIQRELLAAQDQRLAQQAQVSTQAPLTSVTQAPVPPFSTAPAPLPDFRAPNELELRERAERAAQAEALYQQLAVGGATQQAQDLAQRENFARIGQQLGLLQTPQVANTLNQAAAGAQTPTIGATPANVQQSLALTQSLAPQVQVPSLLPAAQTNIRQQNRANVIQGQSEEALRRQQLKALELARQQFVSDIARPIFQRPR